MNIHYNFTHHQCSPFLVVFSVFVLVCIPKFCLRSCLIYSSISDSSSHFICFPLVSSGTQSQIQLERSKSRMGTFVEGGPMSEPNPDEG